MHTDSIIVNMFIMNLRGTSCGPSGGNLYTGKMLDAHFFNALFIVTCTHTSRVVIELL